MSDLLDKRRGPNGPHMGQGIPQPSKRPTGSQDHVLWMSQPNGGNESVPMTGGSVTVILTGATVVDQVETANRPDVLWIRIEPTIEHAVG